MAKSREYQFLNGPETPTLPTAGTPTDPSDVLTLGYLDGNATVGGDKVYTGSAEFQSSLYFDMTVDAATTGTDQDVSTPAKVVTKFTNASLDSIRSIVAPSPSNECVLILTNGKASGNLTLKHEDAGATAADRIDTGLAADLAIAQGGSAHLYYDTNSSRWRVISSSAGGGGAGGGSTLVWGNESGDSPSKEFKYFNQCWSFDDGLTQNLYSVVKVPQGYTAGNQISLRIDHFHEAASATQLLSAQSTLIQSGDAFDDVTDQHTSTNTAIAAGDKVIQTAVIDLTDGSGQINSVPVAAGDLIKIRLFRGTDASTSPIFFVESSAEVTFQ